MQLNALMSSVSTVVPSHSTTFPPRKPTIVFFAEGDRYRSESEVVRISLSSFQRTPRKLADKWLTPTHKSPSHFLGGNTKVASQVEALALTRSGDLGPWPRLDQETWASLQAKAPSISQAFTNVLFNELAGWLDLVWLVVTCDWSGRVGQLVICSEYLSTLLRLASGPRTGFGSRRIMIGPARP